MGDRLTGAVRAMMSEAGLTGQFDIHQGAAISHGFVGKLGEGEDMRVTVIITPIDIAARVSLVSANEPLGAIERFMRTGD